MCKFIIFDPLKPEKLIFSIMKNYKRYLVTSALPYANGPIHIGHLAGVYVSLRHLYQISPDERS